MNTAKQTFGKCTVYVLGAFGYSRREVKEASVEVKPYAQYTEAVHLTFKEPRQKLTRGLTQGYKPNVVILEGWGHPKPESALTPTEGGSITRHASFDPAYEAEFADLLTKHLFENPTVKVLADFRGK